MQSKGGWSTIVGPILLTTVSWGMNRISRPGLLQLTTILDFSSMNAGWVNKTEVKMDWGKLKGMVKTRILI